MFYVRYILFVMSVLRNCVLFHRGLLLLIFMALPHWKLFLYFLENWCLKYSVIFVVLFLLICRYCKQVGIGMIYNVSRYLHFWVVSLSYWAYWYFFCKFKAAFISLLYFDLVMLFTVLFVKLLLIKKGGCWCYMLAIVAILYIC